MQLLTSVQDLLPCVHNVLIVETIVAACVHQISSCSMHTWDIPMHEGCVTMSLGTSVGEHFIRAHPSIFVRNVVDDP